MRINTIIEIAKKLNMNIDELEVESLCNGQKGYSIFDGEKTYTIELILTKTEYMSALAYSDMKDKLHRVGRIENMHDPKEIYDLLTFIITHKLI